MVDSSPAWLAGWLAGWLLSFIPLSNLLAGHSRADANRRTTSNHFGFVFFISDFLFNSPLPSYITSTPYFSVTKLTYLFLFVFDIYIFLSNSTRSDLYFVFVDLRLYFNAADFMLTRSFQILISGPTNILRPAIIHQQRCSVLFLVVLVGLHSAVILRSVGLLRLWLFLHRSASVSRVRVKMTIAVL